MKMRLRRSQFQMKTILGALINLSGKICYFDSLTKLSVFLIHIVDRREAKNEVPNLDHEDAIHHKIRKSDEKEAIVTKSEFNFLMLFKKRLLIKLFQRLCGRF